jgi:hypothetical protein
MNVLQQRVAMIGEAEGHGRQAVAALDDWTRTLPGRPHLQALVKVTILVHISIQQAGG